MQPGEFVAWKNSTRGKKAVGPGLYCFDQLAELVSGTVPGLVLSVDKATGVITSVVPDHCKFQFSSGLASLLGLPTGWLATGAHTGASSINMWPRALHLYLDQLSCSHNVVDGTPSTLLNIVHCPSTQFGCSYSVEFHSPHFKRLQSGTIGELNIRVTDGHRAIDNHACPIALVLEVR